MSGLRIHHLHASDVLRLDVVDIDPAEHGVVIGGRNGAGKSSVLNAIAMAIGGGKQVPERALREGKTKGEIVLDLGEFVLTRTWRKNDNGRLKIEARKGFEAPTGQKLLDRIYDSIAFDPFAWSRANPKQQREDLLRVADLGIDLDANLEERSRVYTDRTVVGRERDRLRVVVGTMPDNGPVERVDIAGLAAEFRAASEANAKGDAAERRVNSLQSDLDAAEERVRVIAADLSEARAVLAACPHEVDTDAISKRMDAAEITNAAAARAEERGRAAKALESSDAEYDSLSARIAALDDGRESALSAAKLPLPGLGFDETGITFDGIPFGQIAQSERLRISCAMAMEMNRPANGGGDLRVLLCRDGALLDDENLALLCSIAKDSDYQIWIETVGENERCSIIMEDGKVK